MRVSSGTPSPQGAAWDGRGANFALFSAHAERVELCLFDAQGEHEIERIALPERTGGVWHGCLDDVGPGQLYGYRVHGPYAPERGFRFNPNKLLLDPYARKISQAFVLDELHFGYRLDSADADLSFDARDSAASMPKAVVVDERVTSAERQCPAIAWADTIIYEAHVKGVTRLREDVPPHWRGTFRGLSSPAVIEHLKRLGVTTLELLPVHAFIDEWQLLRRGLRNYWGYNTLLFFAPHQPYGTLASLREAVDRLHDAGIEVVLDVVFNHSAESDHLGPTLSFRGIDNASYYRLKPDQPRFYENFTGCGNTLNLANPQVLGMVRDSLRYWVDTCGIDGFRFDLAPTLARTAAGFDRNAPFFAALAEDPILSRVKLIAEPWDLGPGGYRTGDFPAGWSEWNDRFRSAMRRFWSGEGGLIGEVARRMSGSADLFQQRGRLPSASINYVTVHDGFTLADLVSYARKHNEENREGNGDGSDLNDSANCGVEGPTDDPAVRETRGRLRRALLSSLMLAKGVPLLLAGDEAGNSQRGNNNAYCQDNEIGWVDWSGLGTEETALASFIDSLVELRRNFPQLRADSWLEGRRADRSYDILWLTPDATEMTQADWTAPDSRFLCYLLSPVENPGSPLYVAINAAPAPIDFKLPAPPKYNRWTELLNSASPAELRREFASGAALQALAHSVLVFAGKS
ncbi:MAG TPA: glycogen debranching protein GlgX [Xanthobacteraceae bacterium]